MMIHIILFCETYSSLLSFEYPANVRHSSLGPSIAKGKFCQVHSSARNQNKLLKNYYVKQTYKNYYLYYQRIFKPFEG